MKNFTKKFQYKSILALLVLLPVILLLYVTFTMSKYVTEKKVGNLTLNLTSINVLLPELQFRNTLDTSVTEVVFGRTEDYKNEIIGIEPKNVDVNRRGKIKMYVKGTRAYVLSDRKIYANPNAEHMFYDLKELTAVHFFNFDTGIVTDMRGMFRGCGSLVSVYVGSGWNTDNASSSGMMFTLCKNLSGGKGTVYDEAHTDKAYARIDGGTANPGYFTDIADKP